MTTPTSHFHRALITGWFSFDETIATAGDLLGGETVRDWLQTANVPADLALAPYMQAGVNWRSVDPAAYDLLVFTTGPLKETDLLRALLNRFSNCTKWAVNVSLIHASLRTSFDKLWVRDSLQKVRPDTAFAEATPERPVIAVAYAPPQAEYPAGKHELVQKLITDWVESRQLAAIVLDMDMFAHHTYPRIPAQIESIIARVDAVVSMRLHATVLGLKHGKPVIATDPVSGGAKISRQAELLEWPQVILPDDLSESVLDAGLAFCLSGQAKAAVAHSQQRAEQGLHELAQDFRRALYSPKTERTPRRRSDD